MSVADIVMLVIGCLALIALIVFLCLYYYWKKKRRELEKLHSNEESLNEGELQHTEMMYSVNERLDGARVSHRREHADRKAQEATWKEKKEHEMEEKERRHKEECNNDVLMIFSPVSGEVDAIYETDHVGMSIIPTEDKLYAPMSGIFHYETSCGYSIVNEASIQTKVTVYFPEEKKVCEMLLKDNRTVCAGECVGNISHGLRNLKEGQVKVTIEVSGQKNDQILLVKKVSFASHGDKIITVNKL